MPTPMLTLIEKKNTFFFNFSNVDADESADADANADANAEVNANGESGIPIENTFVLKTRPYTRH